MFKMKDEFYTGVGIIDNEHKELFEIASKAHDILTNEFLHDKFDYIVDILNNLKDYAQTHFKNEEAYMESIGYDKLEMQKKQHQAFIEKVEEYDFSEIDEEQVETILDILNFIMNWLKHHILENDMLIAEWNK